MMGTWAAVGAAACAACVLVLRHTRVCLPECVCFDRLTNVCYNAFLNLSSEMDAVVLIQHFYKR